MAQLNVYVPDDLEKEIRQEARSQEKSLSSFLTGLIRKRLGHGHWEKDFFTKVVGRWEGDFPNIDRDPPKERDRW